MTLFIARPISTPFLHDLQNPALRPHGNPMHTMVADQRPGYPCRMTLEDAPIGEEVLLFSYCPFSEPSPYREIGPIFVRKHAVAATPSPNEVPEIVRHRSVVLRGYGVEHQILDAMLIDGAQTEATLTLLLTRPEIAYVHARTARNGCFLCRFDRAEGHPGEGYPS